MPASERNEAFEYGYVCARMFETLMERAATIGLTPDEVQIAIQLDRDIKQVFDADADRLEAGGQAKDFL